MSGRYVIALDQGTTSSRSVLIDHDGRLVDSVQRKFPQIYPQPGWVEQNPQEIIFSQLGSLTDLLTSHALTARDIDSIGITNQRETTMLWDRETGRPIANAIVWQCPAHRAHHRGALFESGSHREDHPHDRPAAGRVLFGKQDQVAARQHGRRTRPCR